MNAVKQLAYSLSHLAAVFVAPPAPAHRPPTEDDVRSEQFRRRTIRKHGSGGAQADRSHRVAG